MHPKFPSRTLWLVAVLAACVVPQGPAPADDVPVACVPETRQRAYTAVERGLDFLQRDATKWREEKKCSTCHHGTMTMWVQLEAKNRGFKVSAESLQDNVRWAKDRILERIDLPRDTRPGWLMVNSSAIYLAVMARAMPGQDAITAEDLNRTVRHLLRHQDENGAWAWSSAPPKNRPPPFFESDEVATRLACLALAPYTSAGGELGAEVQASLARAEAWLQQQTPSDTTQAMVLRLLMAMQSGKKPEEIQAAIGQLLQLQKPDGGWAQVSERPSDAYATGQVLYTLQLARVAADSEPVQKGMRFLISTQNEDGSWPMTRRGHPGVTPSENVVPIVYFGSAWGTLGLMRCLPEEKPKEP